MSLGCPKAATCFLCTPPGETKHYFFLNSDKVTLNGMLLYL